MGTFFLHSKQRLPTGRFAGDCLGSDVSSVFTSAAGCDADGATFRFKFALTFSLTFKPSMVESTGGKVLVSSFLFMS
jgi:hypothetical protein